MACNDFNNDGSLSIEDVYIYYAWYSVNSLPPFLRPNPITVADVQTKYDTLFPNKPTTISSLPTDAPLRNGANHYTDYNNDGSLSIEDVYTFYAWYSVNSLPPFLRPNPITVADVQTKYDTLFPNKPTTIVYIPELVCITPTPTPTPTPTHCYNHPDFVFNQTQGTYHCSIQGAIDVADDGDHLKLSADQTGTTYITYEQDILIDASKPKNLIIDGRNIYTSGYGSMIKGSSISIDSNAAALINLELSGCDVTCTSTLSTTTIESCYIRYSCDSVADYSIDVNLTNSGTTFILSGCTVDSKLKTDPLSSSNGVNCNITTQAKAIISDSNLNNSKDAITITNGDCVIDDNDFAGNELDIHLRDIPIGTIPSIRQNKMASTPVAVKVTSGPALATGAIDMSYNYWGVAGNGPTGRVSTPNYLPADTSPYYTDYIKSTLQS